ncbi:MAG: hypothetical protein MJE77_27215 [Proteobacteria bacterium]|nr:hypothetical protein [Pseudomonadota bacterium]
MAGPDLDRQRRFALLACALWVLGFEVAPNLHIGFHDLFADHHHGDSHTEDRDGNSPDHGDGSIEHRGVAILEAPPPPVIPQAVAVERLIHHEAVADAPYERRPVTIRGRGPPVVVTS